MCGELSFSSFHCCKDVPIDLYAVVPICVAHLLLAFIRFYQSSTAFGWPGLPDR